MKKDGSLRGRMHANEHTDPEFLKDLGKEAPFRVPENYFRDLGGKIMQTAGNSPRVRKEVAERKSVAQAEPEEFPELPRGNSFSVPEGYFDALPGRIRARIGGFIPGRFARIAAAACFTLLLSALGVLQVETRSGQNLAVLTELDEDILVREYLQAYVKDDGSGQQDLETYILNQVDEDLIMQEL